MLTDSKIRSAKPLATKQYKLTDPLGLYLLVSPSGSRLWYYRYTFESKESRRAFGAYPQVELADAREKRDAARKLLKSGICPSQTLKAEKGKKLKPLTKAGPLRISPKNGTSAALNSGQQATLIIFLTT